MITAGKLRRELSRFGKQIARVRWYVMSPLARSVHDFRRARRLRLTDGGVPAGEEVALLLVFQPRGLAASIFHTLEHLRAKGLAPLVVSNAPLSDTDRLRLAEMAWRIIERPNFGYDFGGYRDGILHLIEIGAKPKELFLLNDSIWFPLGEDSDLIDRARASQADLFGFALNDGLRRKDHRHLQSYFVALKGRLLQDPRFKDFWRRLFLSNDKDLAIRHGEIAMTRHVEQSGHSIGWCHKHSDIVAAEADLDAADLRGILTFLVDVGMGDRAWLQTLAAADTNDDEWRHDALHAISSARPRRSFLSFPPEILIGKLASPLLKKSHDPIYRKQRKRLLECGFDKGFAAVIRSEVRQWDVTGAAHQ